MQKNSPCIASGINSNLRCTIIAAASAVGLLVSIAAPAHAEGAHEYMPGGMFDFRGQRGTAASKKVTRRLRGRVKRTNAGGIPVSSRDAKKPRKVRKRKSRRRSRRVRVASLGNSFRYAAGTKRGRKRKLKSITGGSRGVRWVASSRCLNGRLKAAINHVARNYGRVRVNSTCRSRKRNRRAGGARRSYHLSGNAADIRVWGNVRAAARYLRRIAGGYKHYGGGLFHIDTGPRRRW